VREELRQSLDQLNKEHDNGMRDQGMYAARPPAPFHDDPVMMSMSNQSYCSRGASEARTEDKFTSDTPASLMQSLSRSSEF
jgi:hypothetical protein